MAHRISLRPSRERLSVIGVPGAPARKPVGSGPSGTDRSSVASAHTVSTVTPSNSAVSRPERLNHNEEPSHVRDGSRVSQNTSPAPTKAPFAQENAVGVGRQPSLPTPSQTPVPQPPSPSAPSAPSHAPSQVSPRPSVAETASIGGADRQEPRIGMPPAQQPGDTDHGSPPIQARPFGAPGQPGQPQQQFMGQPPRPTGSPAPSQQEHSGTMSKLFGKKERTPTQQFSQGQPPEKKEKTSSKLLGAFRRSSKQVDQPVPAQQQQPPFGGPPGQGRGQFPPQMQAQMQAQGQMHMPGGRGQMPPQFQGGRGQGPPPGQFQGQPQMSGGRGQPPPQMQAGRGQMPQQGHPGQQQFPQAQGGRGQPQQPGPNQWAAGQQKAQSFAPAEQQYAPVPIPRGYEAVHGYGQPNMMAPSTYNLGHQYTGPGPQQWNPQHGPPQQQQQGMPGPGQMVGHPGGAVGAPIQQQQQQPPQPHSAPPNNLGQPPAAYTSSSQSSLTSAPVGPQQQQISRPIQPDEFQNADSASVHSQQGPPSGQPQHGEQISRNPTPAQYQGALPGPRSQGVLSTERSQFDESPTISPEVAVPVAGTVSPPAVSNNSPPAEQNYTVSPPMPEDNSQGRIQHDPMAVRRIDTAQSNVVSAQNVPVPDSASSFSPVNPAAGRLANPPPPNVSPPNEEVEQPRPKPPAQHRLSDIRFVSTMRNEVSEEARRSSVSPDQSNRVVHPQHGHSNLLAARAMNLQQQQLQQQQQQQSQFNHQHANGNGPQTPVQNQPPAFASSNPNMNINVAQANGHKTDSDDYYDATPRVKPPVAQQSTQSPVRQNRPVESPTIKHNKIAAAAAAGGAVGVLGAAGAAASVSDENLAPNGNTTTADGPNGYDQDRDAEEKQVVEEAYELPAVNDNSEDLLVMSATSYPGQEWNPYGAGEFGDYE
ncbi:hypothetical protein Micbo1qcDRAFT_165444 [Microdochium bolleyi]|uniref:Uncharacterized protein n=1 Tax=Microdochium bolleyi TaxID=196109 RepID=A0A136IWI8_9PEZI|nr:hypothetical protein Micbo1qcDRAFT_165444 [Microdochium bolleyi]